MRYQVLIPCRIPRSEGLRQLHDAPTVMQGVSVEAETPESALSLAVAKLASQFPALSPLPDEAKVQLVGSGSVGTV